MAQADTPKPRNACSEGRSSHLAWAPVQMMSASQVYSVPESPLSQIGLSVSLTSVIVSETTSVPTCSAWAFICSISHGPWTTSAKPG